MTDKKSIDDEFWLAKWQTNQIGFHDDHFHPMLVRHYDDFSLAPSTRVFLPLCGKSHDLKFFRERGHEVVGIELSEIAVNTFFEEHNIGYERGDVEGMPCYRADGLALFCGDFFSLASSMIGSVDAIYDRAALIALPPELRPRYAAHLLTLCPPPVRQLLITVSYPEALITPPPFLVSESDVMSYYAGVGIVDVIGTGDTHVKGEPGTETVYLIKTAP